MRFILLFLCLCVPSRAARNVADAATGNINFGTVALFKITGDLSWAAWVKFGAGTFTEDAIARIEGGTSETEADNILFLVSTLGVNNAFDIQYLHEFGAGNNQSNSFDTNLVNDVWHHIALVRTVSANTVDLYVDCSLFGTYSYTTDPSSTATNVSYTLFVDSGGGSQIDDLSIAEVVLADVAWNTGEISGLCVGRVPPRRIHYSKLGISSPESDWSGNGNSGTVTGTTISDHAPVGPMIPGD